MKPISKHAALGVLALALALLEAVPDCADPVPGAVPTGSPTGCLGETFHVLMESHGFHTDRENAPGNLSATGFHRIGLSALTVRGTFVRELREGKPRWVSRSIDWKGHWFDDVVECSSDSCDAGGQMELGPSDGGADSMTPFERNVMKWNCKPVVKTGNCFGYFIVPPIRVPFPRIIGTRETLRSGCCYSSVDPGGTHFSEWVEQRGNEKVTIEANPTDIVPNQSGKFNKKGEWVPTNPDEATSQLTIKATCDGVSLADRQVGVRIDVEPRSGYHDHDGTAKLPRPRGTLAVGKTDAYCGGDTGELPENSDDTSCITVKTNANGEAKVRFKSPLTGSIDWAEYGAYKIGIAGDYRITAKDAQITEVRANTKIRSRVLGLVPLTPTAYLQVDRGDTGDHADGSYGTPGTLKAFKALANDFHDYQVRWNTYLAKCGQPAWKPIVKLSANDIALP